MSSSELSDEVALRIALATRQLNNTDNRTLVEVLIELMGKPITVRKLSRLRFNPLIKSLSAKVAELPEPQVRKALSYLKGKDIRCEEAPLPPVAGYREGEMPGSVRIAFTSDNGHMIDGQFATCKRYLIYQVAADAYKLVDIRSPSALDSVGNGTARHQARAELIEDCHILCTLLIGAPAASKVVQSGIHPMVIQQPKAAVVFIREFQRVLADSPPPWLAKAMGLQLILSTERRHWHAE